MFKCSNVQLFNSRIKREFGFTLIEVLVVIAVIVSITAVAGGYWAAGIKKGRNTERKSALALYKIALENYASANNSYYPSAVTTKRLSVFCASYLALYIPDCPEDSYYGNDNTLVYNYQAYGANPLDNDGDPTALRWVMWSKLETTDKIWVSCSNGKNGEMNSVDFAVSDANCPL